jgi:hypothetical protein
MHDHWYGYPFYPYYPWPPTYGYGSWYDPHTGRHGEAVVGYGPFGAAGSAAVYNPETGAYARGRAVWDSDEYAGRGYAYNPNSDTGLARNRYFDFRDDEGWSEKVVTRGDEWLYSKSEWQDGRMRSEFETSRGTEGDIYRQREGDTIRSEGTITGENRSASIRSEWEEGSGQALIQGSEGGSGELSRTVEEGQITGSGSFTGNGKTIDTETTRTADGVRRDFETGSGGQGTVIRQGDERAFVGQSGSGDVYAGRDGEVYSRTDDGWQKVQNPATAAQSQSRASRDSRERQIPDARPVPSVSSRERLDRDRRSRRRGFERYGSHQRAGGGRRRGRR